MKRRTMLAAAAVSMALLGFGQSQAPAPQAAAEDPVRTLVGRLDLERYKATIKGLTAVRRPATGDRSQPRGERLDRGSAQNLRMHRDRAHQVRIPAGAPPGGQARGSGGGARGTAAAPPRRRRGARGAAATRRRASADRPASTTIRRSSPTSSSASSTRSRRRRGCARRSTARRSAPRIRRRCTSSGPTWTDWATPRRRTTTAPETRW